MVAFVQSNNLVMLIDPKVLTKSSIEMLEQMCIVVNIDTLIVSPSLPIGSWAKRYGPWNRIEEGTYTEEQIQTWLSSKQIE